MEIVNKRRACQEILATQRYLSDFSIKAQDFWICYYLKNILKADKNTAYQMWERIVRGTRNDAGNFLNRSTFERKWKQCDEREKNNHIGWDAVSEIPIYMGQIQKIKELNLSLGWHKMIVVCMLFYFKSAGKKMIENINISEFAKYVGKKPKDISATLSNKIFSVCVDAGYLTFVTNKKWDSKAGEYYDTNNIVFDIPIEKKTDSISFYIWNPYDFKKYMSLFSNEVVCPQCGKIENKNGKSQTLLCKDCYGKLRKKDRHHHQSDLKV